MASFMLLFRNEGVDFYSLPPEQMKDIISRFEAWYKSLVSSGRFVSKGRLHDGQGTTLRIRNGELRTDGPYCETKEAIGGFFMIAARDRDEAIAEARKCPLLPFGASVEIRAIKFLEEFPCQL